MKKLLTALAVLLALIAAAFVVASLRWVPARRAGPPRLEHVSRGGGALLAGAAVVPLELPAPLPVAGFARLHWLEDGRRDPVAVRAVVLREPGCAVALVSMELLLIPGRLQRAIERQVRDLGLDGVIVAATHTHAGPGAYWDDPLGERLATGPYQGEIFDLLVDRAAKAIRAASAAMQPAYLSVGRARVESLARNRGGGTVDGHLVSTRLVALSGRPVAEVVTYPSHATLLGIENRLISGDWPGALMRSDAERPILFFQGAHGDQSPSPPARQPSTPEAYARALAARITMLSYSQPDPWPALGLAYATAVLPAPIPGATPPLLRRIARNLFYDWVPARARVAALQLGPVTFLAIPAEPVAEVGAAMREAAGPDAEVLSLAGDYLGYVETSDRMAEAAGETVRTYYGPELATRLVGAVRLAAQALAPAEPGGSEEPAPPQNRTAGTNGPSRASNDR